MTARTFGRILVATDFSPSSEAAWATARRLAQDLGAELILVHVAVEAPLYSEGPFSSTRARETYEAMRGWIEKTLEQWAEPVRAAGLAVRTEVRVGVPYREIVALAKDADLVVIGTRGRGGLERALLGSVADRVIRLAPCPVLTAREAE